MAGLVKRIGVLVLALAAPLFAQADDPTRPPAEWLVAPDAAATSGTAAAPRLQSVKVPQSGRGVAVISGKTVVVGERLGDARLIRVSEREAVLQGADGVTHLYLTPDVEKQMIVAPRPSKAGKAGQMKDVP